MTDALKGYKTYIVAALAVIATLLGYLNGQLTLLQLLEGVGLALGLGGNRAVVRTAALLNTRFRTATTDRIDPDARIWSVYAGVALTIVTAIMAYVTGQQDVVATVSAVLGALGLNFLGLGAKKAATGDAT
jgi:hypothetical protein